LRIDMLINSVLQS